MAGGVRLGYGDNVSHGDANADGGSRYAGPNSGADGCGGSDSYACACANGGSNGDANPDGDARSNVSADADAKANADSIETAARDSRSHRDAHARSHTGAYARSDAGTDPRPGNRGVGRHTGNHRPDKPGMAARGGRLERGCADSGQALQDNHRLDRARRDCRGSGAD